MAVARLTTLQAKELVRLFRDEGWHVMHLARYYDMSHASIHHHLKGVQRRVSPINYCPDEVVESSSHVRGRRMNRGRLDKTYEDYMADEMERKRKQRAACAHKTIAVICLGCGEHLEETKTHGARVRVEFL